MPISRRSFNLGAGALAAMAFHPGSPARAASDSVAKGGTLVAVLSSDPATLTGIRQNGLGARVHEGLIHLDYNLNAQPYLATSWEVAPDGLAYTFKLREGVKWHDGKPFTAADVAFSLWTLKEVHPRRSITFSAFQTIETPDDHTVVIKLSQPTPALLNSLTAFASPIIAKHLFDGTDILNNPHNASPVGTGPFLFKEWERGSHILLERNPDYWNSGKPHVERVVVRIIPDAASRSAAFEAGDVHVGGQTPVSYAEIARLTKGGALAIETRGNELRGGLSQVFLNVENEYLKDVRVRRAIAHAIDVQRIIDTVWHGYAIPSPSAIVPSLAAFHDASIKHHAYDKAQAEKLLDEAGHPRGADGNRFKLRLRHNVGVTMLPTAEYLRSALAEIGVETEIQSFDHATYIKKIYTERDFDLDVQVLANGYDPTDGVQRAYWSKNIKVGLPWSNSAYYRNERVDQLLEQGAIEVDPAKRRDLYVEFQRIVFDEVPAINLVQFDYLTLYDTRLKDHTNDAEGTFGNFADASLTSAA